MRHRPGLVVALAWVLGVAAAGCSGGGGGAVGLRIDPGKVVDLSYAFGPETVYWPTAEPFKLRRVAYGRTPNGYWYAANNISMAEHGGTHVDAPVHFAEGKATSAEVPLANCIGPAVVIDVSEQAGRDADYRMTVADVEAFERAHGRVPRGAVVIMRSGWGRFWPDRKRYLGTDRPLDVANLHFPGFSREAAELLVNGREVAAVGIDTASIDYGQSDDFIVHQVVNGANLPAFENLANVEKLPATGAVFIGLPLKIAEGSGGPARVVAVVP
jgi:kynurenine formamidase